MYMRKKTKTRNDKTYTYYQLVESYTTPKGPRQRVVASLGDLRPRPREEWIQLFREVQAALSGQEDLTVEVISDEAKEVAERVRKKKKAWASSSDEEMVEIHLDRVETKEPRELGPQYVGIQMWERLELDGILESCGLPERVCKRIKLMAVNALCEYKSEHAMPGWAERTAIGDLIGLNGRPVSESALYRALDALLPYREQIEDALAEREKDLFRLPNTVVLYDLTSTYFEGEMKRNPSAKLGYSRDHRGDCKQLVLGLIVDVEGFAKGHIIFDGNRRDSTTFEEMVALLDERCGHTDAAIIMDRGLATEENRRYLRREGRSYIVACPQGERDQWHEAFFEGGWEEVVRPDPPTHPGKKRCRMEVKQVVGEEETYVLCRSEGRKEKDAAIRRRFSERMETDLEKLRTRVAQGRLKKIGKIHQAVGRLRERYSRVARYYDIDVVKEPESVRVEWRIQEEKRARAEELDGTYILETNRRDLTAEMIWTMYITLTRVEGAFRHLKSTLNLRPVRHHLPHRAEAHLFLCVLAYHLLHAIETTLRNRGEYRSWDTIRQVLRTHQVNTIVLPATNGDVYQIRKPSVAEAEHREIYKKLSIDPKVNRYPITKQRTRK